MHTDLAEKFDLASVITGLAADLALLRGGAITIEDARVRADLARQMISATRLYVQAQKYLDQSIPSVNASPARITGKRGK